MGTYTGTTFTSTDGLSIFYRDYPGPPGEARLPVLCLHGLTRNSADFEDLAPHLAAHRRVLAMDVRGRGRSDRDPNWRNYHPGTYIADTLTLLDREHLERVALVGTSMGGLIGMMLGAERPQAMAGLILNDIGPAIDPAGLARIAGYVGKAGPAATWEEAREQVRAINEVALPDLPDEAWDRFARRTYAEDEQGRPVPAYDPAIATAMAEAGVSAPDMWAVFDALREIPILVLRGERSGILALETVREMQARHGDVTAVEVANRGHAPMLDEPAAIEAIGTFLERLDRDERG